MTRAHLMTAALLSTGLTGCVFKYVDPEREYTSEEIDLTIALSESAPIAGLTITADASDPALLTNELAWSLEIFGNLTNTAEGSAEISLWQLTAPWDGGALPEDAFLLDDDAMRGVVSEEDVRENIDLDGYFDPNEPLYIALTLAGAADVSGELTFYLRVYGDDEELPNEADITFQMSTD